MSENIDPKAKRDFLTMIGHSLEVLEEGGLISDVNRQSIRNGILETISELMDQRAAANARTEAAEARVPELQAALDAAINMNIEKNAKVTRLTAALREANEDGLDIATLEYAAKWIENSLAGETSDRVIEFGKSMAMSIRAAKPLVKICAECGGSGEVAGDYFSDDGMSTCARCNGVGHERI